MPTDVSDVNSSKSFHRPRVHSRSALEQRATIALEPLDVPR
jgi:hypothetical protein